MSKTEIKRYVLKIVICFAVYMCFVLIMLYPMLGFIPAEAVIFSCIFAFLITAYLLTENWFKKRGSSFFYIRMPLKNFLCVMLFGFMACTNLIHSMSKATGNTVESMYKSLETGKRIDSLYIPEYARFSVSNGDGCVKILFHTGHETGTVQTGKKEWKEQKIKRDDLPLWLAENFYEIKDCGELFILVNNYLMAGYFRVKYSSDGRIVSVEKPKYHD